MELCRALVVVTLRLSAMSWRLAFPREVLGRRDGVCIHCNYSYHKAPTLAAAIARKIIGTQVDEFLRWLSGIRDIYPGFATGKYDDHPAIHAAVLWARRLAPEPRLVSPGVEPRGDQPSGGAASSHAASSQGPAPSACLRRSANAEPLVLYRCMRGDYDDIGVGAEGEAPPDIAEAKLIESQAGLQPRTLNACCETRKATSQYCTACFCPRLFLDDHLLRSQGDPLKLAVMTAIARGSYERSKFLHCTKACY